MNKKVNLVMRTKKKPLPTGRGGVGGGGSWEGGRGGGQGLHCPRIDSCDTIVYIG